MNYSITDLTNEINEIVNAIPDTVPSDPRWISQTVINRHPDIQGSDKDFYLLTSFKGIRKEVTTAINKFKLDPENEREPKQLEFLMPGYKRVQRKYLVEIDGEQIAVPVADLTDDQIELKIKELESMSFGCIEHADELRRYRNSRNRNNAA